MKKIFNIIIAIILLPIIAINVNAFGFGVTQPSTIFISPGESKIVEFSVQTGSGDIEDVMAKLDIVNGNELIEIIEDTEYFVPASGETKAKIKLNMPKDANPKDQFHITLSFKANPIREEQGKMVSLGYGVDINFDVFASEPEFSPPIPTGQVTKEINYNSIIGPIVVIVIAAIATFLIARRKPKNKAKKSSKKTK